MSIITLTTDWSKGDYYVAAVKGAILKQVPDCTIIDVSHDIKQFQTSHAAFLLKHSFPHFPAETIHIIGVNTEISNDEPFIVCRIANQYFLGIDNGQFSLISETPPELIVEIQPNKFNLQLQTFPVLNLFVDVACELAKRIDILTLGIQKTKIKQQIEFNPAIDENSINARIIYIDSYGNAITNITREIFDRVAKERKFNIWIQTRKNEITQIINSYNEVEGGTLLAVFNSLNLLEIAINKGSAVDLLGLKAFDSTIIVRFKPSF